MTDCAEPLQADARAAGGLALVRERLPWLAGLSVPLLPFAGWALNRAFDTTHGWWLPFVVLYVLLPLLEPLLGDDSRVDSEESLQRRERDPFYRGILLAWLPLHLACLVLGAWAFVQPGLPWFDAIGLVLSIGLVTGGGINVAHELGHKRGALARWSARLALAPACYGHFLVEHNRGHHVRVATPEDPASARLGESFWRFLPRTLIGSLRSAWALETARLSRDRRAVWTLHNEVLLGASLSLVLFGGIALITTPWALLFLVAQGLYGATTLESVNYIEHYGLRRTRRADGRYERCTPAHSWNSNRRLTNLMLFHLQRHADHHAHPLRPFQTLRHFDSAPQLPAGYATLVPLTWLPPLWFALMDRRVLAFYGGRRELANLG